jgi:bla regulator protein blaR1
MRSLRTSFVMYGAGTTCVSAVTGSNLKRRIEGIIRNRSLVGLNFGKQVALGIAAVAMLSAPIIVGVLSTFTILAQDAPDWQTKAGGKMSFEVASVKPSKGAFVPSDFPLNSEDAYRPTGGRLRADVPLSVYIEFAYKLWPHEEQRREFSHLPKWVTTDRYSVEARAATGNPTKDQMRLMVQSLLADRFHLAAHFETREVPVFALTLVKAGRPGPKLVPHAEGPPCDQPGPSPGAGLAGFPPVCGSMTAIKMPGSLLFLVGSRDVTMDVFASSLSEVPLGLGRPVINKTGLKGSVDFTLEWAPEPRGTVTSDSPAVPADQAGPTPVEALHDQLGLKLESTKGPLRILIIDRVERPSEN